MVGCSLPLAGIVACRAGESRERRSCQLSAVGYELRASRFGHTAPDPRFRSLPYSAKPGTVRARDGHWTRASRYAAPIGPCVSVFLLIAAPAEGMLLLG